MAFYYGYPMGESLSLNVKKTIKSVRENPPSTQHIGLIKETLEGVANISIEYNLLELGRHLYSPRSLTMHIVKLTATTSIGASHRMLNKLLKTLSDEQLTRLVEYLETLYFERNGVGYMVTPISASLEADFHRIIDGIRHHPPATAHIPDCTAAQLKLIHTVLMHCVVDYADYIQIGSWGMKIINGGMNILNSGLNAFFSKNIQRMNREQLLTLADFYEVALMADSV
jgi:hypothetical protein